MSWNYRIVHQNDGLYSIHEVYYNDDDKPYARSDLPASFGDFNTLDEVSMALRNAFLDSITKAALTDKDIGIED